MRFLQKNRKISSYLTSNKQYSLH